MGNGGGGGAAADVEAGGPVTGYTVLELDLDDLAREVERPAFRRVVEAGYRPVLQVPIERGDRARVAILMERRAPPRVGALAWVLARPDVGPATFALVVLALGLAYALLRSMVAG